MSWIKTILKLQKKGSVKNMRLETLREDWSKVTQARAILEEVSLYFDDGKDELLLFDLLDKLEGSLKGDVWIKENSLMMDNIKNTQFNQMWYITTDYKLTYFLIGVGFLCSSFSPIKNILIKY